MSTEGTNMPVIPETASVHEKTVQAVASGEVQPTPRRRRTRAPRAAHGPSTDVHTHIQLDKRVLAEVKRIVADRSNLYSTYEMVDHETAIVR